MPASAQTGSHSITSWRASPSVSTTSSRPRPNTADGSGTVSRAQAMMSRRNGSRAAKAGNWARGSPKTAASFRSASGSRPASLRPSHRQAAKKNTAKPPMTSNSDRSKPAVTGTWKRQRPVASSVSTSTAPTAASEALSAARPMAMRSTSRIAGQSRNDTVSSLKIGSNISSRVSGGKSWLHHVGAAAGCFRTSNRGKTVCRAANARYMASAQGSRAFVRWLAVQTDSSPKTARPATRCTRRRRSSSQASARIRPSLARMKLNSRPVRAPTAGWSMRDSAKPSETNGRPKADHRTAGEARPSRRASR